MHSANITERTSVFDTDLGYVHSPPCKGGVDAPLAKWIRSEKRRGRGGRSQAMLWNAFVKRVA